MQQQTLTQLASPRGAMCVGTAAVLFGTSATASQLQAPGLDAASVGVCRIVVVGAALVLLTCLRGEPPWRRPVGPGAVLLGSVTVLGFQLGYFAAVDRLGVGPATLVTIATAPLVAAVVDHQRGVASLSTRWVAGALLAVCPGWRSSAVAPGPPTSPGTSMTTMKTVKRDVPLRSLPRRR